MKTILAIAAVAMFAASAYAHTYDESGNITAIYPDQADTGLFALVEDTAPGTHPNGLFYYTVNGVIGGDSFTVKAQDGQEPFVVGLADECPGPDGQPLLVDSDGDTIPDGPNPAYDVNDEWVLCNNHPDFDLKFTGGAYTNGPGDEAGTVPGDGEAVITLFFGDVGEGFDYHEEA